MRDIEVKRATAFPGVPDDVDRDRRACPISTSAICRRWSACGSGGAPLPVEVAKIFERRVGMKLKSGWGMTETCSPGTAHPEGRARTSPARSG